MGYQNLGTTTVNNTSFQLGRDEQTGALVFRQNNQNCWKSYTELPKSTQRKLETQGYPMVCEQTRQANSDLLAELARLRRTTTVGQEDLYATGAFV